MSCSCYYSLNDGVCRPHSESEIGSEGASFWDLAEQDPRGEDSGLLYIDCGRRDLGELGVDQFSCGARVSGGGARLSRELG